MNPTLLKAMPDSNDERNTQARPYFAGEVHERGSFLATYRLRAPFLILMGPCQSFEWKGYSLYDVQQTQYDENDRDDEKCVDKIPSAGKAREYTMAKETEQP
jgi:hypothetical protein